MNEEFKPVLYIIMRKDCPDMNPGKGMAQACHAQSDFDHVAGTSPATGNLAKHWYNWQKQAGTFGTTIVLSATLEEIQEVLAESNYRNLITDPTYPFRNWYGDLMVMPMITCAWVFATTQHEKEVVDHLELHQ